MPYQDDASETKNDISKLLLRLFFGGIMLVQHGWPKVNKFFAEGEIKFADPLGIGTNLSLGLTVFAEFICAFLILLGLFTRFSSIMLIITMAVAAFVVHGADPFAKKELALLYLVAYLAIFLIGPGRYSVDAKISRI